MTLQSGTLLGIPLFERFAASSQQALDAVFTRCHRDPACHGAFPHLTAEWARLRASIAARPVTLPARLSPTRTTVRLDSELLGSVIHHLLLSASTAAYIPLLIHTLAVAKDRQAVLAPVIRHLAGAGLPSADGNAVVGYPIRCTEPWARFQPGQLTGDHSYYYSAELADARWWQYVCSLIPVPGAAASYPLQEPSSVPVLMINGTADPQDPPASMSGARAIWPNSRLLIEPGQSHDISLPAWQQCDAGIVQAFIEHADAKKLNTECLSQVGLPAFPLSW